MQQNMESRNSNTMETELKNDGYYNETSVRMLCKQSHQLAQAKARRILNEDRCLRNV